MSTEPPNKQMKSRERVADHGEVFTGEREVKLYRAEARDEVRAAAAYITLPTCRVMLRFPHANPHGATTTWIF